MFVYFNRVFSVSFSLHFDSWGSSYLLVKQMPLCSNHSLINFEHNLKHLKNGSLFLNTKNCITDILCRPVLAWLPSKCSPLPPPRKTVHIVVRMSDYDLGDPGPYAHLYHGILLSSPVPITYRVCQPPPHTQWGLWLPDQGWENPGDLGWILGMKGFSVWYNDMKSIFWTIHFLQGNITVAWR